MTKITEQDRSLMISQLKELSKLSLKANIKHHEVIEKHISHSIDLAKFMKEDRGQIQRLNNVIDIKQREIDELNSKQMELLWDLAKLEKKVAALEKEKELDEKQAAQIQKRLAKEFNLESTDN